MDIFLDLDGTLTDNRIGIMTSVEEALAQLGEPVPDRQALLSWIGPPLKANFVDHLGSETKADQAVALYRERYRDIGLFENEVYDGVPQMMDDLITLGSRLWLATSKPHVYAQQIVAHFGLDTRLQGVFGSEMDGQNSDKTELLTHAIGETSATERMMLGDRRFDMQAARATGCIAIGALWGFGSANELTEAGADYLADTPASVAKQVKETRT
ncbi:MAG: HAD hydrolase-like protein [Pseudomonadota bacterium]